MVRKYIMVGSSQIKKAMEKITLYSCFSMDFWKFMWSVIAMVDYHRIRLLNISRIKRAVVAECSLTHIHIRMAAAIASRCLTLELTKKKANTGGYFVIQPFFCTLKIYITTRCYRCFAIQSCLIFIYITTPCQPSFPEFCQPLLTNCQQPYIVHH